MKQITQVEHLQDNDLLLQIDNKLEEKFNQFSKIYEPKSNTVWLTRNEVCKRLGISLPTLSKYINDGILDAYIIGKNIRLKEKEVEKSLKKM